MLCCTDGRRSGRGIRALFSENLLPGMTTDIDQAEDVEKHRRRRMLKAIHVPYTFAPDPGGGTEIYVEALARELRSCGVESLIVAPSSSEVDESYNHQGLRVRRYREGPQSRSMLREIYGSGSAEAAAGFAQILDEERPDLIHIHAFTRAVSVLLVQAAKQRGLPVFFTYHTPTVSCQRGTLMVFGKQECDGALDVGRCSSCSNMVLGCPSARPG